MPFADELLVPILPNFMAKMALRVHRIGAQPTQGTGAQPTQGIGAQPTQGIGAQPTLGIGAQPTQGIGAQPTQGIGAQPTLRKLASGITDAKIAPKWPPSRIAKKFGARGAKTLESFIALSARDDFPGAPRVRTVKFLMVGVDGGHPKLYLIQTNRFSYHYEFATEALKMSLSLEDFNAETYFRDSRKNLAGTILFHESFIEETGEKGLFAMEYWPTDPVRTPHIKVAYRAIRDALPFLRKAKPQAGITSQLAYHPAGATQERLFEEDNAPLQKANVRVIVSADLFANVTFTPMNLGVSFGTLRVIDESGGGGRPPSIRDVVVLKQTPNDLSHVAGIVTEAPQTPLSHINLKAKQNGTPNAYMKSASALPLIKDNVNKVVRFEVRAEGLHVAPATPGEVEGYLDAVRPKTPSVPQRDLSRKVPAALRDIHFEDSRAFGAKAANVAELLRLLGNKTVPDGFGLPFWFYDQFMEQTGLYDAAKKMAVEPTFIADEAARDKQLSAFRKSIKKAKMPDVLLNQIGDVQNHFQKILGASQPIRARSSTNNEDLPGFNGAGLYDSYTHRPEEGHLEATIKQVFASLFNFRAFEERTFYRTDHFVSAMGVLLHPNEDDERANGVAYTKNIYDPNWPGFYINAQLGESLVTNPDAGAKPEELLISRIGENGEYESQYISRSSLVPKGQAILTAVDIERLVRAMEKIQPHFAKLYGRPNDKTFAMDIEFKIRKDGSLQIKQARPTVD